MKLYFRDNQKQLRGVEVDWNLSVLQNPSLRANIQKASGIAPKGPILGIVPPTTIEET